MKFTKMEALGNDYIYINCFTQSVDNPIDLSIKLSDRHFGIGSDGIILIKPSDYADFCMEIYNADGSQAKMCGNGIRSVAKYVFERGLTDKTQFTVETLGGTKTIFIEVEGKIVKNITVDMQPPVLNGLLIPTTIDSDKIVNYPLTVNGNTYNITCVSMGNPHCVIFVEDTKNFPVEEIGKQLEFCELFPERANIEFVQVINENEINMRVWERGSGETLACGTGSCASVVACVLNNKTSREVVVHLLGGDLKIKWDEKDNVVYMIGNANFVFDGELNN